MAGLYAGGTFKLVGTALDDKRLRGSKTIAAHLGATQSTAMRWARHPDFPVLRSATGGSVYASAGDLDAWLARREAGEPSGVEPAALPPVGSAELPAVPQASPVAGAGSPAVPLATTSVPAAAAVRPGVPLRRLLAAAVLADAVLIGAALLRGGPAAVPAAIPPAAAAAMLEARQQMATRSPQSLALAIAGFTAMIARHPDLPAAFTGLADSYLLSCEYASMPRAQEFAAALAAVRTALALAPADPDSHRNMGFLTYWTDRDIDSAIPDFEAAVAGDRPNYLASMWYGNALIDAGRIEAGAAQLDRALAAAPDSPAVLTDHAIARWQAGDAEAALRRLDEVGRRFPQHSAAPGFAGMIPTRFGCNCMQVSDAPSCHCHLCIPIKCSGAPTFALLQDHGNNKVMKSTIFILAAVLGASSASAGDFTGPWIEGRLGYDNVQLTATANGATAANAEGGFLYGAAAGYDFAIGSKLILGAQIGGHGTTARYCETVSASEQFCLKAGRDLEALARLGVKASDDFLVYALAGYANSRLSLTYVDTASFADSFSIGSNGGGVRFGAGVEQSYGKGFAKFEYRYTSYGKSDDGVVTDIGLNRHQLLVAVGYRF